MSRRHTPGSSGIIGILGGVVGVGLMMSLLFGSMTHWIPIALVILVSLKATQAVNRRG